MKLCINGTWVERDGSLSLAELLMQYGISSATGRIAVAVNEKVILRSEWPSLAICEGDRIEIIHAVQGG